MSGEPRVDELPTSLQDVAETLGVALALKLVQHFGGVELKVPHGLKPGHPLLALGEEDARRLCAFLGGGELYVPKRVTGTARPGDVASLEAQGMTRAQIARRLGLSQRHVRRLGISQRRERRLANRGGSAGQADLFD